MAIWTCFDMHQSTSQPLGLPPSIQIPMLGPLQGLQQNNQLQNQQQQQGQQQPPQQQQGPQNPIPPPPPANGQDYTLSSVLHFLQTEWRRYERDRNEWEIERAEMRARIALLEGERRSFENVKLDLMRRIKMLEYALRMERSKQLTPASTQSVPPAKLAAIQAQINTASQKEDGSGSQKAESGSSSPHSEDSPLPPEPRLPNGLSSIGSSTNLSNLSKPPPGRDPKSRARSRDYLKQCLQEVQYLTSPQAMNPLPNRPLLNNASLPLSLPNVPPYDIYNGRPRKVLPDTAGSILNGVNLMSGPSSAPAATGPHMPLERSNSLGSTVPQHAQPSPLGAPSQSNTTQPLQPSPLGPQFDKDKDQDFEQRQVTMIFKDEAGDWKERLRLSHEAAAEQARLAREGQIAPSLWGEPSQDDDAIKDDDEDDEEATLAGEEGGKIWKAKRTLRNHLDAVRALSFHPTELCLATGGDDCTVKIWRMDVAGLASSNSRPTTEVEPQITLRGHSAPITKLAHSPSKNLLYSASLDSSIRIWALPSPAHKTYASYDESLIRGELIGHTDAVWDLALVRDESKLISCGAEGMVKVWDVSGPSGGGHLKLSWGYSGLESEEDPAEAVVSPGATAVEALKADLKKVAVAYQNAVVKIFEIESGKELTRLASDASYDGTPSTQVNRIVSHATMTLLVTAHEDNHIRIFDFSTGQCTHSMQAHLDGVTALSIDPAGFSLVSGSHDCSIRFWELLGSRSCTQEIPSHREKAREGVLDVEFHPSLPFMASAGADGVVKLYASSATS